MKYLLDTHFLLWTLFEPEKLSNKIIKILKDDTVTKYFSGISIWEISLKYSLGKLELKNTNPEEIHEKLIESGFESIQIENEIFGSYYKLQKKDKHKDPFDRLLIWQAINNNFTIISNDGLFKEYIENGLKLESDT